MKTTYVNGRFVPAEEARVSVFDRGFLYGDGLFETLRFYHGKPFHWQKYWDRLEAGARVLHMKLPITSGEAMSAARQLLEQNGVKDVILRINVSRGIGLRGYSATSASSPAFVMTLHDAPKQADTPARWSLLKSELRVLKNDPLARIKSVNKLLHVLAKTEAEQGGFNDALLLNSEGEIAEATGGNFFWIQKGTVYTPPLNAGILAGVTRSLIFNLCHDAGIACEERVADVNAVAEADAAFLTLTSLGIVEVERLDETRFASSELILKLFQGYRTMVALETGIRN